MSAIEHLEHHYSLSLKEGWFQRADDSASPRKPPQQLTLDQLGRLTKDERLQYDDARLVWHANLGPYFTPQMEAALETIDEIVETNRQDGDRLKTAAALDAAAGIGKTTLSIAAGVRFHHRQIAMYGPVTSQGHQRVPVIYLPLMSATTPRSVSAMTCRFLALPGTDRGNAMYLANRAADATLACETRLFIIDEANFIDLTRKDGRDIANHFKWLQDQFPVTFFFVGVGLQEKGLFSEGDTKSKELAQTGRRWTRIPLDPFEITSEKGRRIWRRLLKAIERDLVLARKHPGMLADDLADYLYARSSGHFGSLMTLIGRGCRRAIKSGDERLTAPLLDRVRIDEAAEHARVDLEPALKEGLLSARAMGTGKSKARR